MAKEKIINIRVETDLKKRAKRLAERDGRSLSNWILRLIEKEIKDEAIKDQANPTKKK
jgi:predicted HicB family RNase H-like nuclease